MNIALITARGGSKGLPRKNILSLCGKPLICWTIEAALNANKIDKVFVSTEDDEIKEVSLSAGALCIDRPLELASDKSSSESVIIHALDYFSANGIEVETVTLLQPTSPLRNATHIDDAMKVYESTSADMVLSVVEPAHTPLKSFMMTSDGQLTGVYSKQAPFKRRQDLPRAFNPNGAIYIFDKNEFLKQNGFPNNKIFPYIMNEQESADIDILSDLLQVEKLIKEKE